MIIVMNPGAGGEKLQAVLQAIKKLNFECDISKGAERTTVGILSLIHI